MPWRVERRDPFWELEGRAARRSRTRRHATAAVFTALSVALLVLLLQQIATIDATRALLGTGRPLVFSALISAALACCLIFVRETRRRATA